VFLHLTVEGDCTEVGREFLVETSAPDGGMFAVTRRLCSQCGVDLTLVNLLEQAL
jgi:hypothetical protein